MKPATKIAFAILSLALAWVILGVRWLPMQDLPQHAAQIAEWAAHDRGDAAFSSRYSLHFFTPYLSAYATTRLFLLALPLRAALALVIALSMIALPLVVARELRLRGGDPRWAAALFPLGFSMVLYWGLFNFLVGLPLVPWFLGVAERTSKRRTLGLLLLGAALLSTHVLLFAFASATATLQLFVRREPLRRAWPILALWPVALAWLWLTRQHEALAQEPIAWHWAWTRFLELPREMAGLAAGVEPVQAIAAALLLLSPFGLGARPSPSLSRWLPAIVAAALFLCLPFRAFGNACLYPRFATLVVPLTWLALDRSPRALRLSALVPIVGLVALASVGLRFVAFDAEARELDPILAQMQPGKRTLSLSFAPVSGIVAAPVYTHVAMWHEADGGGPVEPSFASRYPMLVRFRDPSAHAPTEMDPRSFRYDRDGDYDYFVVRAARDVAPIFFDGTDVHLLARSGAFWLYGR